MTGRPPPLFELIIQARVSGMRCSAVQRGGDELELLIRKRFIAKLERPKRVDIGRCRIVVDHLGDEAIGLDAPMPLHRKRYQFTTAGDFRRLLTCSPPVSDSLARIDGL